MLGHLVKDPDALGSLKTEYTSLLGIATDGTWGQFPAIAKGAGMVVRHAATACWEFLKDRNEKKSKLSTKRNNLPSFFDLILSTSESRRNWKLGWRASCKCAYDERQVGQTRRRFGRLHDLPILRLLHFLLHHRYSHCCHRLLPHQELEAPRRNFRLQEASCAS